MEEFIKDGTGITRTVTKQIIQHYEYKDLLEIRKNLTEKLNENAILIAECEKLGVISKEPVL
jgi:hypothetical protein